MALNIEDGTVVTDANSYVTLAEFTAWLTDRGHTTQAEADDEQKEIALIKATDYMQAKFRQRWKGSRIQGRQPLDWPRRGVDVPDFFDPFFKQVNVPISFQDTLFLSEDEVPEEVKRGQMMLAFAVFSGATASGTLQAALGRVTKREKLGELEVEYFSAADGSTRQETVYWDAKNTIEPFLLPTTPFGGRVFRS